MPGTNRSSSGMLRAPLARISSRSSTVMLPGTSDGACFSRVALSTVGSSRGSRLLAWTGSAGNRTQSAASDTGRDRGGRVGMGQSPFFVACMVTMRSGFFIIASLLLLVNIYCWLFICLEGTCMSDLKGPVTVLGGGRFGTTLANLLASNGVPTTIWLRDEEQAAAMRDSGENARYLPG